MNENIIDAIDWLNEIITNPNGWRMFYSDSETKNCAEAALILLKKQEARELTIDEWHKWKYLKTEETIIGMDEETSELKKFNVFCCPQCEYEVTEWQLQHSEFNYCPKCGNKNEYDRR